MAVVEDEGEFHVMTMRNADRYARPLSILCSSSTRPNHRMLLVRNQADLRGQVCSA
jgi:hypothetical protein